MPPLSSLNHVRPIRDSEVGIVAERARPLSPWSPRQVGHQATCIWLGALPDSLALCATRKRRYPAMLIRSLDEVGCIQVFALRVDTHCLDGGLDGLRVDGVRDSFLASGTAPAGASDHAASA